MPLLRSWEIRFISFSLSCWPPVLENAATMMAVKAQCRQPLIIIGATAKLIGIANNMLYVRTENSCVIPLRDWVRPIGVVWRFWVRLFHKHIHVQRPLGWWAGEMEIAIQLPQACLMEDVSQCHSAS